MTLSDILYPVLALGGIGLVLGLGLGWAAKKLKSDENPLLGEVRGLLPGANCGGCGCAGCDAFAAALLDGSARPASCTVGGQACVTALCGLLGLPAETAERRSAFVRCGGCAAKSAARYAYSGLEDCGALARMPAGGPKLCSYGCLGGGSCRAACRFGAVTVADGLAAVDGEKCTACGRCVKACPKKIIAIVPREKKVKVACASQDAGKAVRVSCSVGCIGCKLCEKACKYGAIRVTGNLARIDYEKCAQCGECVKKCPGKCIAHLE